MSSEYIESVEELRRIYSPPAGRAVAKQLALLDSHCRRFIELSPSLIIASVGANGCDASPRGGLPGFVKVAGETTLWVPDAPGNNRLDSLVNIIATGAVGLLFLIPGVDESLRINGTARLSIDAGKLRQVATERREPKLMIEVTVKEAFLHCAKALMRSRLWSAEARQDRSVLPTIGQMLADQTATAGPVESQEEMLRRYERDL
jgi:PPOX class probable FMN-dependent enzyme